MLSVCTARWRATYCCLLRSTSVNISSCTVAASATSPGGQRLFDRMLSSSCGVMIGSVGDVMIVSRVPRVFDGLCIVGLSRLLSGVGSLARTVCTAFNVRSVVNCATSRCFSVELVSRLLSGPAMNSLMNFSCIL